MSGLSDSRRGMEERAIGLLKAGIQPVDVQRKTGLSLTWIETKARTFGIKPLTVEGVQ